MKFTSRSVVISLIALVGAIQLARFDHTVIDDTVKVAAAVLFTH